MSAKKPTTTLCRKFHTQKRERETFSRLDKEEYVFRIIYLIICVVLVVVVKHENLSCFSHKIIRIVLLATDVGIR